MMFGTQEASCTSASDRTTVIVITRRTFGRKYGKNPRNKLSVLVRNNHFVKNRSVLGKKEIRQNSSERKTYWQLLTGASASYEMQHSSVISGTSSGAQVFSCQTSTPVWRWMRREQFTWDLWWIKWHSTCALYKSTLSELLLTRRQIWKACRSCNKINSISEIGKHQGGKVR